MLREGREMTRLVLMRKTLALTAVLTCTTLLSAQTGFYIHDGAEMRAHENAQMSIKLDTRVDGALRSSSPSYATRPLIYFEADTFSIESTYGDLRPVPFSGQGAEFIFSHTAEQYIRGGAVGLNDERSYFPNLRVNNPNNLYLQGENAGIRSNLEFEAGKLVLEGQDLISGTRDSPGQIFGYDEQRYVVTNGPSDQVSEGFLVTYLASGFPIDWPIGQDETHYSPARLLKTSGDEQQVKIRVWEGASQTGFGVPDITNESCGTTWDIVPTGVAPTVDLQLAHDQSQEGVDYTSSSNLGYITHHVGYAPNMDGGVLSVSEWDRVANGDAGVTSDITTGAPVSSMVMHTRSGISSFSPFSKATTDDLSPLPVELLTFEARAVAQDGFLYWTTASEIDNEGFFVQHSRDGLSFADIGFVVGAGHSSSELDYSFTHINPGLGVHYYRLRQVDFNGDTDLSEIRSIDIGDQLVHTLDLVVYPNPVEELLNFKTNLDKLESVTVLNALGLVVYSQSGGVVQRSFDVSRLARGTYMLMLNQDPSLSQRFSKL